MSMFTQWVPHTWYAEPHAAELEAYADRRGRADGRGRARVHRLGAAPPGDRAARDGARVRPGRRQHLPRRAVGRADVPRAARRRLRRPAHADPRPVPGRLGDARRRRRHRRPRPQRRPPDPRRPAERSAWRDRGPWAAGSERSAGRAAAASTTSSRRRSAVERERVLLAQLDLRRPAATARPRARPGAAPARLAVVDLHGESVLVTADPARATLHAHANVCRHRGSQVVPVDPDLAAARAVRRRCAALPVPLVDLRPRRPAHHAPHTEDVDDFDPHVLAAPGGRGVLGRLPVGARRRPDPHRPCSTSSVRCPSGVRRYPLDRLVVGRRLDVRGRAPTGRSSRRTTTSATTAARCTPSWPGWCRRSAAAVQDLPWEDGIPHREGAWTFTLSGTIDRGPFPDLDEDERVRHKGELVYPNLLLSLSADHVAAFPLTPRRPTAPDRLRAALRAGRGGEADLRPVRRRPTVGPGQPAGLGDLRVGPARHVAHGPTPAAGTPRWRTRRLDIRRWLLPRLGAATWTAEAWERRPTSSSGSAHSGRPRPGSWPGAGSRCSGSSSSSSATTGAPPTTRRGSSGTAITRRATSA